MTLALWKKSYDQSRQHIENQRHYFAKKVHLVKLCFSSGHVWMWELDHNNSWEPKSWSFELWSWRRLLKVPFTARRSNQSILKEISPVFPLEGMMLKVKLQQLATWCEELILRKDPDAVKDWKQEKKGKIEGEMVGWHHRLDGHEFDQAPSVGEGQGYLVCCSSWGHKESITTEQLNWIELNTLQLVH